MTAIVWLRDDLRLDDQPALRAAAAHPALVVYVHDETSAARPLGGASRWWLDKSLAALADSLEKIGGRLDILRGSAEDVIPALARDAEAVFWTRRYGGAAIETDKRIKAALQRQGVKAESFNGQLLREPWTVKTDAGAPFKVFTPFWRRCREMGPFEPPQPAPKRLAAAPWPERAPPRAALSDLGLHPTKPDWSAGLAEAWRPGEAGARARLAALPRQSASGLRRGARPPRRARRPRGCRRICASAKSPPAGSSRPSRRRPSAAPGAGRTSSFPSLAGANSPIRCSTSSPRSPRRTGARASTRSPGAPTRRRWRLGGAAARAIPSWTPACGNFGRPATCTIACG